MNSSNQKTKVSLVFFGTGPTSLEALQCLSDEFEIALVVTKPPATNSAGKEFINPVHSWSAQNNLPYITPCSKRELEQALKVKNLKDHLGIVLDYGLIIPSSVINMFDKGILNSHFSLLPKYRGANPIRAAILNGDKVSGVTIIKITPGLDDGPILTWAEASIKGLNAIELRDKLSQINCSLLCETVKLYMASELELVEQDESAASVTKKTTKKDGLINPAKPAEVLTREILAYAGWPKSTIVVDNKSYIIHEANASSEAIMQGRLEAKNSRLYYGCKDGSLEINTIQPSSKPRMGAEAFINGYLISEQI